MMANELENQLDHFVLAKWMRAKKGGESVLKAKDNVSYVNVLEKLVPNVTSLYHRLCSVCHPSSASIEYFFDFTPGAKLELSATKDREAVRAIVSEFPDALQVTLIMHCNPALLMLRVLHKFPVHPQLKMLKKFPWKTIKAGVAVEEVKALQRSVPTSRCDRSRNGRVW
jgi:hypothetical protein